MKHINIYVWKKSEFLVLMEVVRTITTVLEGVNTEVIKTLNVFYNAFRHTVPQLNCYRRKPTVTKIEFSSY
jgi:hypothetical protein